MAKVNIELLISAVQCRPDLWQDRLPNFKNKKVTSKLWKEVGEICGITGAEAKNKWKNTKDTYRKNLRKITRPLSGSDATSTKIKWPYYESMAFTIDTIVSDAAEAKKIIRRNSSAMDVDSEFLKLQNERLKISNLEMAKTEEDCDDLQFFKSLLPFMKKFALVDKLEVRGEIQKIILEKLKSNEQI